jgi:hypothetical protein
MLGYTESISSNVYIFFEGDEIEKLGEERIKGAYINLENPGVVGSLEAVVDDELPIYYQVKTPTVKDDDLNVTQMTLLMGRSVYNQLKERRSVELHEGCRHICLRDVNNLSLAEELNYDQLKRYVSHES